MTWARVLLAVLLVSIYSTLAVARVISNALRDANLLRVTVAVVFGLVVAGLGVVLLRSAALRRPRSLATALAVAALYAAVVWPMESPEEKLHFVEYGAVGVLAFFAMPLAWRDGKRFVVAALATGAAGWVDEGLQALLPSRYYDLRDVGFNALAGVLALSGLALFRSLGRRDDAR